MSNTTQTEQPTLTVTVPLAIPRARISDLLCNALEGGSDYWYDVIKRTAPPAFEFYSNADLGREEGAPPRIYAHLDYPLTPGGSLTFRTLERDEINGQRKWVLDLKAVGRGLALMAETYPGHFADFLSENDDATTGDVFLQMCLFGELIFG